MNKEEFITERTNIISRMLDNPNEYGIYPTTKCFNELDALYDRIVEQKPDCYDKRFIEWMLKNGAYSDVPYKTYTQKWNIQIENYDWVYFTTEEAFEYWKNDIKDKEQ
jgi:hypothetical protein